MRRFTDENVYHCRTAVGRRLDGGRWRDRSNAAPASTATPGGGTGCSTAGAPAGGSTSGGTGSAAARSGPAAAPSTSARGSSRGCAGRTRRAVVDELLG
jgi:hypothetical protein